MECNKEEAVRAREVAEKKLAMQDYAGAKKFAQKAYDLFSGTENLSQLFAVISVHTAAQVKLNGTEMDWYGILQVDPTADEAAIKKQYRKLALLLHPDKNKLVGAEAAFKIIGEASQVLFDKSRRDLHDRKRIPVGRNAHSQPKKKSSGHHSNTHPNSKSNSYGMPMHHQSSSTFWTYCPSCMMRFQYLRIFENQNLLCPSCQMPFLAKDLNCRGGTAAYNWPNGNNNNNNNNSNNNNNQQTEFDSGFGSGHNRGSSSGMPAAGRSAADYVNKVFDTADRRKRMEEEAEVRKQQQQDGTSNKAMHEAAERKKKTSKQKKRHSRKYEMSGSSEDDEDGETMQDMDADAASSMPGGEGLNACPRRSSRARRQVSYMVDDSDDDLQEFPSKMAKVSTGSHLKNNMNSGKAAEVKSGDSHLNGAASSKLDSGRQNLVNLAKDLLQKRLGKSMATAEQKSSASNGEEKKAAAKQKEELPEQYIVPDPDFHNFNGEREEKDVAPGQVWALYDNRDSKPRLYAKVKDVYREGCFEVTVTWLDLRSPSKEQKQLMETGYVYTCGEFRHARSQVLDTLEAFSHTVKWEKIPKGMVRIYPSRGEVWALYRAWEETIGTMDDNDMFIIDEGFYKYDVVEVIRDYDEERGVVEVQRLRKVNGFKSLFRLVGELSWVIPSVELTRFSHRVPAYKMKGIEAPNVPEDCWELDTASISRDLIQSQ